MMRRFAILLLLAACRGSGEEQQGTPNVAVATAAVIKDSVADQVDLIGRLTSPPGGSALLSAPAAGVVGPIHFTLGSRVERGQVILSLDVPELEANARQLAAAADIADREAERQQRLLADGIAARKDADRAASDAASARAASSAAATLLGRTRIASPINGVVQRIAVQSGERVESGALIAEVVTPGSLDFSASVGPAVLGRLHQGQHATVRVDGDTAEIGASIRAVAPAVDSITNTGLVILSVKAHPSARPGASARATVELGRRHSALLVPDAAITRVGDTLAVFVVGPDSIAHQHAVELGARSGGRTQVTGDLKAGDQVVTSGAAGLTDGIHVTPAASAP